MTEPEDIQAIRRARNLIVADALYQRGVAARAKATAEKLDAQASTLGMILIARGASLAPPPETKQ